MILTPICPDELAGALDRFGVGLDDAASRRVFDQIRATSPDRAEGPEADRHRLAALALARNCGMAVHPPGARCAFNWDGAALNGATEAYVILHEIAHFMLAPPERRRLVDFGLGPGPDTIDRDTAERAALLPPLARAEEEAEASLLGIVWEARLNQPGLRRFSIRTGSKVSSARPPAISATWSRVFGGANCSGLYRGRRPASAVSQLLSPDRGANPKGVRLPPVTRTNEPDPPVFSGAPRRATPIAEERPKPLSAPRR